MLSPHHDQLHDHEIVFVYNNAVSKHLDYFDGHRRRRCRAQGRPQRGLVPTAVMAGRENRAEDGGINWNDINLGGEQY